MQDIFKGHYFVASLFRSTEKSHSCFWILVKVHRRFTARLIRLWKKYVLLAAEESKLLKQVFGEVGSGSFADGNQDKI